MRDEGRAKFIEDLYMKSVEPRRGPQRVTEQKKGKTIIDFDVDDESSEEEKHTGQSPRGQNTRGQFYEPSESESNSQSEPESKSASDEVLGDEEAAWQLIQSKWVEAIRDYPKLPGSPTLVRTHLYPHPMETLFGVVDCMSSWEFAVAWLERATRRPYITGMNTTRCSKML